MLQMVDNKVVYVVDLDVLPQLPVVGTGIDQHYAEALTQAIRNGLVTVPGKYGIEIDWSAPAPFPWSIYNIKE